jgi:hypothetical protein
VFQWDNPDLTLTMKALTLASITLLLSVVGEWEKNPRLYAKTSSMLAAVAYRKSSHSVYELKYHIVWITKYRKRVLNGPVGVRLREMLRETCASLDVQIEKGHVSGDHVHMLVSVPPHLSVSKLV